MSTDSCGEDDALDLGGGVDAEGEGSGVERCIVSMLPCVARVVTRLGEVAGVRRLSVVVWSMCCKKTEEDILFFRGDAFVIFSSA